MLSFMISQKGFAYLTHKFPSFSISFFFVFLNFFSFPLFCLHIPFFSLFPTFPFPFSLLEFFYIFH